MKDIIRMNQLAGVITEGQARKMLEVLDEESGEVFTEIPTIQQFKDNYSNKDRGIKVNINGQEYEVRRYSEYGRVSFIVRKKGETNRTYEIKGYDNLKKFLLTGKADDKFVNIMALNNPNDPSDGYSYIHQGWSYTDYLK